MVAMKFFIIGFLILLVACRVGWAILAARNLRLMPEGWRHKLSGFAGDKTSAASCPCISHKEAGN
jgi:hypothetical protein